jgi:hypothetical protein
VVLGLCTKKKPKRTLMLFFFVSLILFIHLYYGRRERESKADIRTAQNEEVSRPPLSLNGHESQAK